MAPRYNQEPINLIHRIPSQKQIDEARPAPAPYGQFLLEVGAKCWRSVLGFLARVTRYEDETPSSVQTTTGLQDGQALSAIAQTATQSDQVVERVNSETAVAVQVNEPHNPAVQEAAIPQQGAVPTVVQPEVISELRSFLIRQQDQIAYLSSEIAQLKSLVVSQQQVLVHLGQELEAETFPTVATGMGPNPAKRGRIVRKTPTTKEKSLPPQEPESQSLNL
ncbi:MAG: hypothetical protein OEV99_03005 [Nitrospira sp.]|nr:hypothetical protein [Nitrospira sp.]MDH4368788.1 hypothetical protein [Nitrospira sp.]MDH5495916.1 hypothetical protein [Nitrospira sp.]MDH5725147.1 hypothetical protein [Nitrospira sp.]